MRTRPFYLVACAFAVAAILFDGAAKQYAGRAARTAAHAAQSQSPEERGDLQSVAHLDAVESDRFSDVAAIALVLGLGAWVGSLWRREPGLQSVPLVLLAFAVLLRLLRV